MAWSIRRPSIIEMVRKFHEFVCDVVDAVRAIIATWLSVAAGYLLCEDENSRAVDLSFYLRHTPATL
jgi:hypothetical protein